LNRPAKRPHVFETLTDRIRTLAEQKPEKDAFVFYSNSLNRTSITRKGHLDKSLNLAYNLVKIGIKKDDLVLVGLNNSLELCIALFGIMFAGGTQYHISQNSNKDSELIEVINRTKSKILILDELNVENINIINKFTKVILLRKQKEQSALIDNVYDFQELVNTTTEAITLPSLYPEDTVLYFSTSGSTSKPKMVSCSHFYLLNSMIVSSEVFEAKEDDIHFNDRPIAWNVGFPRMYVAYGTTRIIVDTRMTISGTNFKSVFDIIEKEKCTIIYFACYLIYDLLTNPPDENKFSSVRTIYSAGQKIRKTFAQIINKYCKKFFVWYGSTESTTVTCFQDDNHENYEDGIIGSPMYGSEVKIVDQNLKTVKWGEKGILMTRNILRFSDYKNRECCCGSEQIANNYWINTGDIAHIRDDGNLITHGRNTEIVTVGTMKFTPDEIEIPYLNFPGVKEAYAISVPDSRLVETSCLCVVPKDGYIVKREDLEKFSKDIFVNELSMSGQSPKPQYFVILKSTPLNENGKVSRKDIKIQALKSLDMSD
jgi:acyl-coenzyme A synthetase/AMP-(fatty) acid ligase